MAVRSWLAVGAGVEVTLYGDSPGTAAACEELGIRHVPDIEATKGGVPYFGAIAAHAAEHARYDVQVYLNCDILLTPHILGAIEQIPFIRFLMIGQRIDLSEGVTVDFSNPGLIYQLHLLAQSGGITLHSPAGSDYFAFKRGMWSDLPPVIIGRGGYDNALIAYCLQRRIPVVDTTHAVLAIHQFHDYGHINGGYAEVFNSSDAAQNGILLKGYIGLSLEDASWIMMRNSMVKINWSRGDWLRSLHVKFHFEYDNHWIAKCMGILRRITNRSNFSKAYEITIRDVLKNYN